MKEEFVTILIPCFNAEKTLNSCLTSILNQDYKNYEVVIIDNNSTDSTKEIIFEFKKKSSKINYIFEPRRGRGAARNAGVKIAKGNIIAMTDSDCIVPRDWVERIIKLIIEGKEEVIQGGESEAIPGYWSKNIQKANEEFIKKNLSPDRKYTNHLDTKNFAIKSSLIKKLGFDSDLGNIEDFELGLRLRKISRIRFLNEIKVKHYHRSSLTKVFAMQFNRAYWAYIIFQKHKNEKGIKNELMFSSLSPINYLIFPFWIANQLVKNLDTGFFLLVSDSAWALGTFYGTINKILNNFLLRK